MTLSALTGIRQGDLLKLKRSDFTNDGLRWTQGKTGKDVHVLWTDALREVYEAGIRLRKTASIWFLPNRAGGPYTPDGFRSLWHKTMQKDHGVKRFRFHDLRGKAGTDAEDWRLLGHTDRKVFERTYNRRTKPVKPVK